MRNKEVSVLPVVVAAALIILAAGCENSDTVTGPRVTPTQPPTGNIAGAWTGTYKTNDFIDCDATVSLPAQASFEQNGSTVVGTLTATGPCGLGYPFVGTLQGNILSGRIDLPPFFGTAQGTLSGTTLEITATNSYGFDMGQMHLHR